MGEHKICYKCLESYDSGLHVCPSCGHNEYSPHNPMYIAPGTKLHDRYLVGVLLEYNGEGATYAAFDTSTECKVMLREYMPINLCTRVKDKPVISVNYNNLAKYKAFMAEHNELNKSLARLRGNSNINPILDMFSENNTTYTVFEHIDGVKMLDYLKDNAGEVSWEQISRLFPPLFTTIGILHNAGIIHRAISPDTVYITEKGELKLSGFCISAVRTANAGLEYELFKGYAAPEQYSADISSRQGSWTDVYGVCALMYRALTGCMPVDSQSRIKKDDLCEPYMLNRLIPQNVSKAVMDGMKVKSDERIQTITELVTRLFEQAAPIKPVSAASVQTAAAVIGNSGGTRNIPQQNGYNPQPPPQQQYVSKTPLPPLNYNPSNRQSSGNQEQLHYEKVSTVDRFKVPIIIGVLLIAILMILSVIIINMITSTKQSNETVNNRTDSSSVTDNVVMDNEEEATETTTERFDTIMPDLVGKYYELTEQKYGDYLNFEVIYEYNDDYETDRIFEQNIEPGEQIVSGSTVRVRVSKGRESAIIPEYKNLTAEEYEEQLQEVGISNYSMVAMPTAASGTPDSVVQLQIGSTLVYPGTLFSNKEGNKLIVYYLPENVEILGGSSSGSSESSGSSSGSSSSSGNSSSSYDYQYQYTPTEETTSSSGFDWDNFNWGGDSSTGGNSSGGNSSGGNNWGEDYGNTGGDSGSIGGDSGNTGGDSGSIGGDSGNTGGDSGSIGGDSGNTGGDAGGTGGDSGNTGGDAGNAGGDSGVNIDLGGGDDSGAV